MARVVSNKKQLTRLVSLMEENPDIVKGMCGRAEAKNRWEKFAVELNSIGPPTRTWDKWMRVWTDLKCKVKKKKSQTQGSSHSHLFSDLEEAVIRLLPLNALVDPSSIEFEEDPNDSDACDGATESSAASGSSQAQSSPKKSDRVTKLPEAQKRRDTAGETQQQTAMEEDFYQEMTESISTMKTLLTSINDYTKRIYYLKKDAYADLKAIKKEKLKAYRDEIDNKQNYRTLKLRIKQQMLELQIRQIE